MTSPKPKAKRSKRARHYRTDFDQLLAQGHPVKNYKLVEKLVHTVEAMAEEIMLYWNTYSDEVKAGDPPYTRTEVIDQFYGP